MKNQIKKEANIWLCENCGEFLDFQMMDISDTFTGVEIEEMMKEGDYSDLYTGQCNRFVCSCKCGNPKMSQEVTEKLEKWSIFPYGVEFLKGKIV